MDVSIKVDAGASELSARMLAVGARVKKGSSIVTHDSTDDLRDRVKLYASGPPGPDVRTGEYRDSIKSRKVGFVGEVYTDKPQARRLEYGFVGVDSLGRHYNDPPRPHWGPAVAEVSKSYARNMEAMIAAATELRGRL